MSKQNIKTKEKFSIKAIYEFEHIDNTVSAFFLKEISGIKDIFFKKKLSKKGNIYVSSDIKGIKAIPKPKYRVSGRGHITGLFKHSSYENSEYSLYIGDIGKDRPYDILIFKTDNNFENSFTMYHIESTEIVKDTLENYIIELFKKRYFDKQILKLDKQYCFSFMYE